MIVKCQKCGHENQHASIFCRKCGVKIDKEQLDAAISNRRKSESLRGTAKTIRRLIVSAVVVFLLYATFMILYPSFFPFKRILLPKKQFNEAIIKLHSLELRAKGHYTFSASEMTALYNKYLISRNLRKYPLSISIDDDAITLSFPRKISESIPLSLYCTVTGTPLFTEAKGEKVIDFKVKKIKLGNLSLPSFLATYIIKEFEPYYSRKVKNTLNKITHINIDKDKGVVVYLRDKKNIN